MQIGSDKRAAVEYLRRGDLIIFPTDTVFGVGCRIDFQKSVERIYQIKKRERNQPLPILLADAYRLSTFAAEIPPEMQLLIDTFWPGPLTVVLPVKPGSVLPIFLNERGAASFRVPKNDTVRAIIRELGVPIAGTSANFHGHPSPTAIAKIDKTFMKQVSYVVEGGVEMGRESTVIELIDQHLVVHREGALSAAAIERIIGAMQ